MLVLVTYDVNVETPEGRRRLRRVAKLCVNHGQRVQNSVFEILIDNAMWIKLRDQLQREIDPERTASVTITLAIIGILELNITVPSQLMTPKDHLLCEFGM